MEPYSYWVVAVAAFLCSVFFSIAEGALLGYSRSKLESRLRTSNVRERFHAYRFGRVVPCVDNVDTEFFGIEMRMVGALARDERIDPGVPRSLDHRSGTAGDDSDSGSAYGSGADDMRIDVQRLRQSVHKLCSVERKLSCNADRLALVVSKAVGIDKTELPRQDRVVSDVRMDVQRDVRRVEGDVALKQGPEPATVTPGDWLKPLPEEPMMDEEEVGLPFEGRVNGGLTRINGDNEPFYLIRPVDLQAV